MKNKTSGFFDTAAEAKTIDESKERITGLGDLTAFLEATEKMVDRARRIQAGPQPSDNSAFSHMVVYIDIKDSLDRIEQAFGRQAIDIPLRTLSDTLKAGARGYETPFFLGGGRFALLVDAEGEEGLRIDETIDRTQHMLQYLTYKYDNKDRGLVANHRAVAITGKQSALEVLDLYEQAISEAKQSRNPRDYDGVAPVKANDSGPLAGMK